MRLTKRDKYENENVIWVSDGSPDNTVFHENDKAYAAIEKLARYEDITIRPGDCISADEMRGILAILEHKLKNNATDVDPVAFIREKIEKLQSIRSIPTESME